MGTPSIARKAFLGLAIFSLVGCSSLATKPHEYWEGNSYAYNLARAGGLKDGIRDVEVADPEAYEHLADSDGYKAAEIGVGLATLNVAYLGISVLGAITDTTDHSERSSFFAWAPLDFADSEEEAEDKLEAMVDDAFYEVLREYISEEDQPKDNHRVVREQWDKGSSPFLAFANRDWNCINNLDYCLNFIMTSSPNADIGVSPSWLAPERQNQPSFVFTSNKDREYLIFETGNDNKGAEHPHTVPWIEIISKTSAKLPDWFYFFISSHSITDPDGKPYPPMIFNQGKAHFFVIPKE